MEVARYFVDKQCDRYAPGPLSRDTPVRSFCQHGVDARPTPVRHPLHVLHRLFGGVKQSVARHTDKPLGGRAKNNRRLVAPAMRVTVLEGLVTQQHISLRERCHDVVIGFENMLTREYRRVRVIDTIAPDGVVDL